MSSGSSNEFNELARKYVRLAEQADTAELREQLFDLARVWMQVAMEDEEDATTGGEMAMPNSF